MDPAKESYFKRSIIDGTAEDLALSPSQDRGLAGQMWKRHPFKLAGVYALSALGDVLCFFFALFVSGWIFWGSALRPSAGEDEYLKTPGCFILAMILSRFIGWPIRAWRRRLLRAWAKPFLDRTNTKR